MDRAVNETMLTIVNVKRVKRVNAYKRNLFSIYAHQWRTYAGGAEGGCLKLLPRPQSEGGPKKQNLIIAALKEQAFKMFL